MGFFSINKEVFPIGICLRGPIRGTGSDGKLNLLLIYYIIREYRTGSRVTDNFFSFAVSGLYIFSILLFSNSLIYYRSLR